MNAPLDIVRLGVSIRDDTNDILQNLITWYASKVDEFQEKYVDLAKEACAFDDFTHRFNNFFVEEMLSKYPDDAASPWFQMVSAYTIIMNIFTDTFGGLNSEMLKSANNTIEQIRPETGTLDALVDYHTNLIVVAERLRELRMTAMAEQTYTDIYRAIAVEVEEQNIIIDHVGNYVQESGDLSFQVD